MIGQSLDRGISDQRIRRILDLLCQRLRHGPVETAHALAVLPARADIDVSVHQVHIAYIIDPGALLGKRDLLRNAALQLHISRGIIEVIVFFELARIGEIRQLQSVRDARSLVGDQIVIAVFPDPVTHGDHEKHAHGKRHDQDRLCDDSHVNHSFSSS